MPEPLSGASMADSTAIEWTDATWNPIAGCSLVSPGCTNCYAMKMAARIERMGGVPHYAGLTQPSKAGPVWTGKVARAPDHILTQPLRWKKPRRIFVNSMADLFHDDVPDAWIDQVFAVMALAPRHTFQVLTKRAKRMRAYFEARRSGDPWAEAADAVADMIGLEDHPIVLEPRDIPLPHVWIGVSVEDQARADERIPDLLSTPAAKRFVSAEPLLGPLDLRRIKLKDGTDIKPPVTIDAALGWFGGADSDRSKLDWVIAGGESGPGARPAHPDWFRSLRDQCAAADVPFYFKQWGEWLPDNFLERLGRGTMMKPDGTKPTDADMPSIIDGTFDFSGWQHLSAVGKKAAGALLDGREHREFPA